MAFAWRRINLSTPAAFSAFWRLWCRFRPIRRGVSHPFNRRFSCRRLLCFSRPDGRGSLRRVNFEETFGSFLMQKRKTQCRMASVFLRNPDQWLIRKYQRPGEPKLSRVYSPGRLTIRMQEDAMHHEWIRDSSMPHPLVPPKTACLPLPDGRKQGECASWRLLQVLNPVPMAT